MVSNHCKLGYINLGLFCRQRGEQEGENESKEWRDLSGIREAAPAKGIEFN